MQIKKYYKFFAGHRNQELRDKCFRPHGHLYQLYCYFNVVRTGSISTLFGDFDSKIEPLLKNNYDHRFLVDDNDVLLKYFRMCEDDNNIDLGLKVLPFATSVENLTFYLFSDILAFGFDLEKIELQETTTATLLYTKEDYKTDYNLFKNWQFTKLNT